MAPSFLRLIVLIVWPIIAKMRCKVAARPVTNRLIRPYSKAGFPIPLGLSNPRLLDEVQTVLTQWDRVG
jgi:hypothetical protein